MVCGTAIGAANCLQQRLAACISCVYNHIQSNHCRRLGATVNAVKPLVGP